MDHTNIVKLTLLFSEYVLRLFVQFSGFLLDFALQEFVVNIRLYLSTVPRAPTTTSINIGFRCHICSILIPRSLYFDIFPENKFLSQGTSAQPVNRVVFMIFNCIIRFISINSSICMHCKISKDCGTLFQQQVLVYVQTSFMVCGFPMLADLPMDVLTDSVMSIFIFSRTWSKWSTVQESTPIFHYSGLVIPGAEVLGLCSSHDKSLCKKPLMGISFA